MKTLFYLFVQRKYAITLRQVQFQQYEVNLEVPKSPLLSLQFMYGIKKYAKREVSNCLKDLFV